MGAGGDLGDDAAVARVLRLRVDDVGEGLAAVRIHDRGARVVAGRLYRQDHGLFIAFGRVEGTLHKTKDDVAAIHKLREHDTYLRITRLTNRQDILDVMRIFSLLFAFIALVMLAMFLVYVFRGPVDPLIAGGIFVSFVACLVPALLLLKPFEPPEELRRRREESRREREERRRSTDGSRRGSGS